MTFRQFLVLLLCAAAAIIPGALAGQDIKPRTDRLAPTEAVRAEPGTADKARDLFYLSDAAGEGKHMGLRLRLYQMEPDCELVQVSPAKVFTAGDRLRFGVETNAKGYLYIVQRGSSGATTLLFPNNQINNGDNSIKRGTELTVPGRKWFAFDNTPGGEDLQFILARNKLEIISYLIPPAAGAIVAPSSGSLEASVIAALQGSGRDLVFSPVTAPPQIATSGALYQSTYAVNAGSSKADYSVLRLRLNHR